MAGTSLPPEALAAALSAVHGAGAKGATAQTGPAPGGGGGAPGAPSTSAPTDSTQTDPSQGGDPNAQQDPNAQAVWQEFPATDPTQIESLAQQMQGTSDPEQLVQMLGQFMQQAETDQDKLSQMHQAMLGHLMDLLGGPGGGADQGPQGSAPMPSQGPGVGGNGAGY